MLIKGLKFLGLGLGLALCTVATSLLGKNAVQTANEMTNDLKAKIKPEVVEPKEEA